MLDKLDSINWNHYHHAYGKADDVPDLIRSLNASDVEAHQSSLDKLTICLVHQGSRFEASSYAIPFLSHLVEQATTPNRSAVLRCLLAIALGDNWADDSSLPFPNTRFDSVEEMKASDYAHVVLAMYDEEQDLYDEDMAIVDKLALVWERDAYYQGNLQAPKLLDLARDSDISLACTAISGIPWFAEIHQQALPILSELIFFESIEIRATASLTIGLLQNINDSAKEALINHSIGLEQTKSLRLAGAIALALIMGADIEQAAFDILIEAEDWRAEINEATSWLPYLRGLMGFRQKALSHLGL